MNVITNTIEKLFNCNKSKELSLLYSLSSGKEEGNNRYSYTLSKFIYINMV